MSPVLLALLLAQTTPQMGLPLVTPGVTSPSQFQDDFNQAMNTIDGHNHTAGLGPLVPIAAGVNVQSPFPMNGYTLTELSANEYVDAGPGPSVPMSTWFNGEDFCVELGDGSKVCLTCNGGVCASFGDGGNISAGTITAACFVNTAGIRICTTCIVGPNGASYCFDNGPGDTIISAVDGGQNYVYGNQIVDGGENILGDLYCGGSELAAFGNYTQAGQQTGYDVFGLGNTTEVGVNVVETIPDGGEKIVAGGMGAANLFCLVWDGGPGCQLNVSHLGVVTVGSPDAGDALLFTPSGVGAGETKISTLSYWDPNIAIQLVPNGDGGVYLGGHIDTGNNQVASLFDAGAVGCLGGPGGYAVSLDTYSNDTAGRIRLVIGASTIQCSGTLPFANVLFGNAYRTEPIVEITACDGADAGGPGFSQVVAAWPTGFSMYVRNPTIPNENSTGCWDYATLGLGANAH